MNALMRKEIRLIAPGWAAAMLLAILPVWLISKQDLNTLMHGTREGYWFISSWLFLGLLLPALASFGQEFTLGTFPTLLAQPIARRRIWRLKLSVLTGASAVAVAGLVASFAARSGSAAQVWEMSGTSLLLAAVAMSGGWWTTLLLRQIAPAFWFALLIPFLIDLLVVGVILAFPGAPAEMILTGLLAAYAAAGFALAARLFRGAQDAQWLGEVVALPKWGGGRTTTAAPAACVKHRTGPVRALLGKEFQLQQVTFILAAALLLLHVMDLAARKLEMGQANAHPVTRGILEVVPFLWLLLPLVAGSVTVAEERKLGTLEGQLCGPVSRRKQFAVKLAVALGLAVLLGGLAPIALEYLGRAAGAPGRTEQLQVQNVLEPVEGILLGASLAIGLLAFYASTLTRNTLQGLGLTVVALGVFAWLTDLAGHPLMVEGRPMWGVPLANGMGAGLTAGAVLWLAWGNFGYLHFGARIWRRNALGLAAAVAAALGVDSLVFNRVWEAWTPEEPFHGWSSQSAPGGGRAVVSGNLERMAVVTLEGRLWLGGEHSGFAPGTNWASATVAEAKRYAIKTDGSLWDVTGTPAPFLAASRWRAVAGWGEEIAGLKADGTLWSWKTKYGALPTDIHTSDPNELGEGTNWTLICAGPRCLAAAQGDGSIWRWGRIDVLNASKNWTNIMVTTPRKWFRLPDRQVAVLSAQWETMAAVANDGTLWTGDQRFEVNGGLTRVGEESDWTNVCVLSFASLAAIKTDGTLWHLMGMHRLGAMDQRRLSDYAVWVGIAWAGSRNGGRDQGSVLALARDGALCHWKGPEDNWNWGGWVDDRQLMAPSRIKAVRMADLRGKAE